MPVIQFHHLSGKAMLLAQRLRYALLFLSLYLMRSNVWKSAIASQV
ncbi:hypothetical protein [Coleofasciculus sp. H7-2]